MVVTDPLLERWLTLVDDEALGRELLKRWAEPHRRYHTTAHLTSMLDAVDLLVGEAADPRAVRLATWFHDAVYDRNAGEDEERSAQLAERLLRPFLGADERAEVARLVRLTAVHTPLPGDRDGEVLCDADLAVLGGDPQAYAEYAAAVREEYADVDEDAFRAGRAGVLRHLIGLDPLFRTPTARDRWQSTARRNLTTELMLLDA